MSIASITSNHRLLTAVIIGGLFYIAGQVVALEPAWLIPQGSDGKISVTGTGEIVAQPDVASVSL